MILTIDIGNTNIKYGIYSDDTLVASFRVSSNLTQTADEYGSTLSTLLYSMDIKKSEIIGVIISSVIPSLNYTLSHMCEYYLNLTPLMIGAGTKTGLNLKIENAHEMGADRVANSVGAIKKYGVPLIVVDFGTATTFNVINDKCEFIGGVIAAGIKTSMEALFSSTAKLPRVEIEKPKEVIGKNTITNMQSGIVYGATGLVEYIIKKIKEELGYNPKVVATGGLGEIIAKETSSIDILDRTLTLDGLNFIYKMNKK